VRSLVLGGGSIGARHLNNLRAANVTPLAVVEPSLERRMKLVANGNVTGFETLEEGLSWNPQLVIIATPSYLHVEQALAVVRAGCHVFVEKPLAHTSDRLAELAQEVSQRGIISLVGCNMRFHPGPSRVKALLEQESIGNLLFARIHTGSYLPKWRPSQDYRQSYSASAAMGGGCILDCIHEIDLAYWYMGRVESVFCVAEHLSSLEIDVEDVAMLMCRHKNGILSQIHLDYVQRTYERGCQIVGEQGSIFWDVGNGYVRLFEAKKNSWTTFSQPNGWEINQMYVDELAHLLNCIQTRSFTTLPIPEAVHVMCIALAAKKSARTGCLVVPKEII